LKVIDGVVQAILETVARPPELLITGRFRRRNGPGQEQLDQQMSFVCFLSLANEKLLTSK
jgi:hypothetical protein